METVVGAVFKQEWLLLISALIEVMPKFVVDHAKSLRRSFWIHIFYANIVEIIEIPCRGVANPHHDPLAEQTVNEPKNSSGNGANPSDVKKPSACFTIFMLVIAIFLLVTQWHHNLGRHSSGATKSYTLPHCWAHILPSKMCRDRSCGRRYRYRRTLYWVHRVRSSARDS